MANPRYVEACCGSRCVLSISCAVHRIIATLREDQGAVDVLMSLSPDVSKTTIINALADYLEKGEGA